MGESTNNIFFGSDVAPDFSFDNDTILDITINTAVDMVGEELTIDTMDARVTIDDTDGTFRNQTYATPIWYYRDNEQYAKFYLKQITRVGRNVYSIEAVSIIGLLDNQLFYGGLNSGTSFQNFLKTLLLSNGIEKYTGTYGKITVHGRNGVTTGTKKSPVTGGRARAFHSATMHSKMQAKFTLKDFHLSSTSGYTEFTSRLLGMSNEYTAPYQVQNITSYWYKLNYGMFMEISRASESDPWPAFGTVYFQYGGTKINLGTPTEPTTYVLDVDPVAGTATINGTTYAITDSDEDGIVPLHCALGGIWSMYHWNVQLPELIIEETTEPEGDIDNHYCDCDWEYYRLLSQDDDVQTDIRYAKGYFSQTLENVIDFGTGRYAPYGTYNTVTAYDEDSYQAYSGDCPVFFTPNNQMLDIYNTATFEDGIDSIELDGWLPICTKREALHQVMYSLGIALKKTVDGTLLFTSLKKISQDTFTDDDIYDTGSVEYPEHVNKIEVYEYSFDNTSNQVIFEATDAPSGYYIVEIQDGIRYIGLNESDISVMYFGWNAAVVKGTGKLYGNPLVHNKRILTKDIASYPDGRTIKSTDCQMVTSKTSENILYKLASYYGGAKHIKNSLVSQGERCGGYYTFLDPFYEQCSGFLAKKTLKVSTTNKAECDFVVGYDPPEAGATYKNYVILTGSGTWDVPEEVFEKENPKIHLAIIGGGNGGAGGKAGNDGATTLANSGSTAATGGDAGEPGQGGKILEVILENPPTSISYTCGTGGAGGGTSASTSVSNHGTAGTNTVVTAGADTYTSEDGSRSDGGITNSVNGEVYGKKPALSKWGTTEISTPVFGNTSSYAYGNGGNGGFVFFQDNTIVTNKGGYCAAYFTSIGQASGTFAEKGADYPKNALTITNGGGCGGGGGFGEAGQPGGDATRTKAGAGGDGGNATFTPPKATDYNSSYYGWGGFGGGGGGAGGCSGFASSSGAQGTGGKGGYGGAGGAGGDGCVLIYY